MISMVDMFYSLCPYDVQEMNIHTGQMKIWILNPEAGLKVGNHESQETDRS